MKLSACTPAFALLGGVFASPSDTAIQPRAEPVHLPNPCSDASFRNPVFSLTNWDVTKAHQRAASEYPADIHLSVTLRDTANNYTLHCAADHHVESDKVAFVHPACTPEGGFHEDDVRALMSLEIRDSDFFPVQGAETPFFVQVSQSWFCPETGDEETYVYAYDSYVYQETTISCQGRRTIVEECSVPNLPDRKAWFTMTRRKDQFPQIIRPSPSP